MPRLCKGLESDPLVLCVFGKGGRPAQPKPGNLRCSWCDPVLLDQVCKNSGGRSRLRQVFKDFGPDVAAKAVDRIPEEAKHHFATEDMAALRAAAKEKAEEAHARREEEARKHVAALAKASPKFAAGARSAGAIPAEDSKAKRSRNDKKD